MAVKKKISLAAAVVLVCSLAPIAAAGPAQASARHCALRSDYRKVHHGQSPKKVARELHSKGHMQASARSHGYREMVRSYRTCSQYSAVAVSFGANSGHGYKEDAKDAVWSD